MDDDPTILEISKLMLTDLESTFEIDSACCADEAFKKLTTGHYDAVVSDYEMPKKDGLQFLTELRKQTPEIPFILFTGKGREEVAIKALNLGVDGYYNKQGNPETVYGELTHGIMQIVSQNRLREKLVAEEERFRQLFSNTPMGVAIYETINDGEDFIFKDINSAAEKIEKIEKAAVLGKRVTNVFPGVKNFGIFEVFKRVSKTGKAEYFPDAMYKDNRDLGSWRENWVIKLPNNNIAAIYNDITDRKKTEEALTKSEEKYRQLVNVAQEGIWALDNNYCTVFTNPHMAQMLGYSESELVGKNLREILFAPTDKKTKYLLAQHNDDKSNRRILECKLKRKDSSWVYAGLVTSPFKDDNGNTVGTLALVSDITYSKVLERKVNDYSKHLKTMVDLRTVQLKDANERLVKSERLAAIGELAGMVGHDLRNPLAGIKNATYFLKKKGNSISETQAKETLEMIEKAIEHSNKIINDLLEYAREMHLELIEATVPTLVDAAIRMVCVPNRIQILNHVHEETKIRVDADKIMRIFINLIKNAIDAIPQNGTLEINSCQTKDSVEIAFTDTGTGISQETLPKIFTPLFTTKAQGMGFGLAICKRIIIAHGGTITVKTKLNKGTTFTITLPIKPKIPATVTHQVMMNPNEEYANTINQ